jgi:hypothetical protein
MNPYVAEAQRASGFIIGKWYKRHRAIAGAVSRAIERACDARLHTAVSPGRQTLAVLGWGAAAGYALSADPTKPLG